MFFVKNTDAGKAFGVELIYSPEMNTALTRWNNISSGRPYWRNANDDIETINMAKHIADHRAKLTVLDIGIAVSGSPRADYLQTLADDLLLRLPDRVADADRVGGMVIKYNGETWDFVLPGNFGITAVNDNGEITGIIFPSYATHEGQQYTRLEYHRFEDNEQGGRVYHISNRAFKNQSAGDGSTTLGKQIKLETVPAWAHLDDEAAIENLERPLFGFYRVPGSNTVDASSPLGMSVFANAITELKALDVAISRKNAEIEDSKHITFVGQMLIKKARDTGMELPRFVKGLGLGMDDTEVSAIHEHVPTLLTDQRIKDINFNLSLAGVKCGFSEGVFVLDGQNGMITATQVEADDRDTIQTIKTDRDALRRALEQALYGADVMTTLYDKAPLGDYEVTFNFGDITYSYEEDRAAWKSYVMQGWVPKWLYFVKFEGMSEEEAKKLTQEAATAAPGLFGP